MFVHVSDKSSVTLNLPMDEGKGENSAASFSIEA